MTSSENVDVMAADPRVVTRGQARRQQPTASTHPDLSEEDSDPGPSRSNSTSHVPVVTQITPNMSSSAVGHLTPFEEKVETISTFLLRVKHYIKANKVAEDLKVSVLLSVLGPKIVSVLEDLLAPEEVDSKSYDVLVETLRGHYKPCTLTIVERYKFNSRVQQPTESISDYVVTLKHMASTCNFGAFLKDALRDRLVSGIRDDVIRQRLLTDELNFEDSLRKALTLEEAIRQKATFGPSQATQVTDSVNRVRAQSSKQTPHKPKDNRPSQVTAATGSAHASSNGKKPCYRCGCSDHPQYKCKYKNAKCHSCGSTGHLQKVCKKSGKVQQVTEMDNSDNDCIYRIGSESEGPYNVNIVVNNQNVCFEVDTGSYYTIVSNCTYQRYFSTCTLQTSNVKLTAIWFSDSLPLRGVAKVCVQHKGATHLLDLYVLDSGSRSLPSLLGRQWNSALQLVQVPTMVKHVRTGNELLVSKLKEKFPTVFDGKPGHIKRFQASIILKEDAVPVFCKARSIPFALRAAVEEELTRLERDKVITRVKHSEWATPLVVVPKQHGVRICADFKVTLNRVLEKEHYPLPVIKDIFAEMAGAKFFCILDLTGAYLQLPVRPESAPLLTVNTPLGLFRYNYLPFGLAASPSIFQAVMDEILKRVKGVACYLDDVMVWGASEEVTRLRLHEVLQLFCNYNIKINVEKCQFFQQKVEYLGYTVSQHGIQPTGELVKCIQDAPAPTSKAELQSYLGLLNFYHDYIPHAGHKLTPLYNLVKNNAEWEWSNECNRCFEESKKWVCEDSVLVFYDPQQPLRLTTDASAKGVGAVLSHVIDGQERPISFASKKLQPCETRYSQIEREALAIIFGIKQFHKFLYGRHFELFCDNKPLTLILGEKKAIPAMAAARLQRWAILLAAYDYKMVHKPGTSVCNADFLSRCPIATSEPVEKAHNSFSSVHRLDAVLLGVDSGAEEPLTAADIARETQKDATLRQVYNFVRFGWQADQEDTRFNAYYRKRDELSIDGDCVLWGSRVVIPEVLQNRVLKLLHGGHPGIVKMKMLARSYVWWPKIDEQQENFVRHCASCQQTRNAAFKAPLHHWPVPVRRWQRLHIDFAETRHEGQPRNLLLVVDAYSKWLEVFLMRSITAENTIDRLRTLFASYGLPEEIVSDNGSQLTSAEFADFLKKNKIKHVTSPPYHAQSNGAIERCVQTTKQSIWKQVFDSRGTSLQHKLDNFLYHYRNTPHATTQKTPAEVFLGWMPRSFLTLLKPSLAQFVEQRQRALEEKVNINRQTPQFMEKDLVWVKSRRGEPQNWLPGHVVAKKSPLTFRVSVGGQTGEQLVHADHLRVRQSQLPDTSDERSSPSSVSAAMRSQATDANTTVAPADVSTPPRSPRRTGRLRRPPARLQF